MLKMIIKLTLITLLTLSILGCATTQSPRIMSELAYGKRLFKDGFYRRSMNILLPLACEGVADAQYAIGYLYYYGYAVCQDTDVGYFWIKRAANAHYLPAVRALAIMQNPAIAPQKREQPVWTKDAHLI
jgi:TPR repeat protein